MDCIAYCPPVCCAVLCCAGLKFLAHDAAHINYVVYEFASLRCELTARLPGSAAGFLGREPAHISFLPSPEVCMLTMTRHDTQETRTLYSIEAFALVHVLHEYI